MGRNYPRKSPLSAVRYPFLPPSDNSPSWRANRTESCARARRKFIYNAEKSRGRRHAEVFIIHIVRMNGRSVLCPFVVSKSDAVDLASVPAFERAL